MASSLSLIGSLRTAISTVALLLCAASAVVPETACADSWAMPTREQYLSPNGQFRLTVEPADIESQMHYFEVQSDAAARGEEPPPSHALGMLEQRGSTDDAWIPVWAAPLANSVAPVDALVSNDGRRVVTFDNWHSVGYGPEAIVLLDEQGRRLRSFALTDLVGEEYFAAFPRSVSSLRWKEKARFSADGTRLQLSVIVPTGDEELPTVLWEIALADGTIVAPPADEWQAALECARARNRDAVAAEQARLTYLKEPLAAPMAGEMPDWHAYLREAFLRLTPDFLDDPSTSTTVLFAPDNPRHAESVGWLVEEFADASGYPDNIAVASPNSDDALVAALRNASSGLSRGALVGTSVYVSIGSSSREAAQALVERTGARFVWLDPAVTIPQRGERIPGSPEANAAEEELYRRRKAATKAMLEEIESLP